ncbi:MAG: hypothetical protein MAGBODY4_00857 [Candidatus Marinimicrobia bacterium]|nr:hypothetical protein [Candidatus Neomarinimicrobiota bacterium]
MTGPHLLFLVDEYLLLLLPNRLNNTGSFNTNHQADIGIPKPAPGSRGNAFHRGFSPDFVQHL